MSWVLDDWPVVCSFMPEGWQGSARTLGALHRARQVRSAESLLRLLLLHLADGRSLADTASRAREYGWCDISAVGVFKRLAASEHWLRWLVERMCHHLVAPVCEIPPDGPPMRALFTRRVREPGTTWSHRQLMFTIRLNELACDHYAVSQPAGGRVEASLPVSAGDVFIANARTSPATVTRICDHGGGVIVRIRSGETGLRGLGGESVQPLLWAADVAAGAAGVTEAALQCGERELDGQLFAVRRSGLATEVAHRRMCHPAARRTAKKGGFRETDLPYIFVWTSAPQPGLAPVEALELYRMRWWLGGVMHRMKRIFRLGHVPRHGDGAARAWVHGKLLVALLAMRMRVECGMGSPWGYSLPAQ